MRRKQQNAALPLQERGEPARKRLIEAGLKIYSEVGYRGASTRNLAAAAGVNIAAIPYYFGSKEGLYLAVIDYIVDYYRENLGNGLRRIRQALQEEAMPPARYDDLLADFMRTVLRSVLKESDECIRISRIYVREQLDPTSAFERLYEGFIRDMRETLEALVAAILHKDAQSPELKLIAETLLGQVAIFKSSRITVLHKMGWKNYGPEHMDALERIITFNAKSLMHAYQHKDAAK